MELLLIAVLAIGFIVNQIYDLKNKKSLINVYKIITTELDRIDHKLERIETYCEITQRNVADIRNASAKKDAEASKKKDVKVLK